MNLDWRQRLRGDPANWLLDADDNPSVAFWFLRDIVHRPEDAATMLDLREQILFSQAVQDIFAAQNALGYWHNPDLLDQPRHRSTLWTLARLTELGIPRTSRRARAACEFALGNLNLADKSTLGLLAHSLTYFNYRNDARLASILDSLATDAEGGNIFALWALADATNVISREWSDREILFSESSNEISRSARNDSQQLLEHSAEQLLNRLARGEFKTWGAFPSFDADDALLALRVLGQLNRWGDARAASAIENVWARQGPGARWALDKSYEGSAVARVEIAPEPSKWATLNVLRVITQM